MPDIAIHVENPLLSLARMSKLYTIGAAPERHDTTSALLSAGLRDTMADWRMRIADRVRHIQDSGLQDFGLAQAHRALPGHTGQALQQRHC